MSTLVNVPKNGGYIKTTPNRSTSNPIWSSWIDDIFNHELPSVFSQNFNTGMSLPMVNIKETEDAYFVEMAVPGFRKSDFQINLDTRILSIATEREGANGQKEDYYTLRQFGYTPFKRTFSLPETVDDGKIEAMYKEGILSIHLPKKAEINQKPARRS